MTALLLLLACGRAVSEPAVDPAAAPAAAVPVSAAPAASDGGAPIFPPPTEARVPPIRTPKAMYEACRDRVELPEAAGECQTDADCARAGCSQEVCVSAKSAADVMTTCEEVGCAPVLDTCGCHEGLCSWSLKLPLQPGPDAAK